MAAETGTTSETPDTVPMVESAHDSHHGHAHPMPLWQLLAVFFSLMILTFVTVAIATVDLGELNLPVAMLVAAVKASLVVLFFMHVAYDRPFIGLVAVFGLLFLAVFLIYALIDTNQYKEDIDQSLIEELRRARQTGTATP